LTSGQLIKVTGEIISRTERKSMNLRHTLGLRNERNCTEKGIIEGTTSAKEKKIKHTLEFGKTRLYRVGL